MKLSELYYVLTLARPDVMWQPNGNMSFKGSFRGMNITAIYYGARLYLHAQNAGVGSSVYDIRTDADIGSALDEFLGLLKQHIDATQSVLNLLQAHDPSWISDGPMGPIRNNHGVSVTAYRDAVVIDGVSGTLKRLIQPASEEVLLQSIAGCILEDESLKRQARDYHSARNNI